jgi:hypothetical protein
MWANKIVIRRKKLVNTMGSFALCNFDTAIRNKMIATPETHHVIQIGPSEGIPIQSGKNVVGAGQPVTLTLEYNETLL